LSQFLRPWIRNYNYISDYYHNIYRLYTEAYVGYPVNYYTIDWGSSTVEHDKLEAGTYSKFGVGDLSGLKWNKILLVPIYGLDSGNSPSRHNADEKGMILETEKMNISFPTTYGIKPYEWDIIHFHQSFMDPENPIDTHPLYVVTNTNMATFGTLSHWQLQLKTAPYKRHQVEKQVSNYYMFLEFTKRIHRVDTASVLLRLEKKSEILSDRMTDLFSKIGFHLQKKEV